MSPTRISPLPLESVATFLKRASTVASSYGFAPLEHYRTSKTRGAIRAGDIKELRRCGLSVNGEVLSGLSCFSQLPKSDHTCPIQYYYAHPGVHAKKGPVVLTKPVQFGLEIVGTTKSVAEALVLRAALAILEETGLPDVTLHINSVGDRDSSARFARELSAFMRRLINDMPQQARELMKEDLFAAFEYLSRRNFEGMADAPRSLDYLSEASRGHFSEVLEYLETMGVPYRIEPGLVGERNFATQTIFEIRPNTVDDGVQSVIARGGRYDEVGRRLFRTPVPAAGITFTAEPKNKERLTPLSSRSRKPKLFFIQVGPEARLRSLAVLDALREARVPLLQGLGKDRLQVQLEIAQRLSIPYTIIMGHKEALENAVIVRNMENRSQVTVPISNLSTYIRENLG